MLPHRPHVLRVSLIASVFLLVIAATALLRKPVPAASFTGLPGVERAYWTWVGTVNRVPAEALDAGRALVGLHPDQHRFYLRLAELCRQQEAVETCLADVAAAAPTTPRAALHRDAAHALLADDLQAWHALARADVLDPALARRLVDRAQRDRADDALADYEAAWAERLAADSTAAGAAFGLGYTAVLRGAWEEAERLLLHAATVRPDDVEAYRELGRVYYVTGQPERFEETLTHGIRVAGEANDLEAQTILRGNLGLSLLQRGSLDEAETLFKSSLATSRALSDAATEGFNLYRLASVRLKQHRYDDVFPLLDSAAVRYAAHAPRQAAEVRAMRGATYSDLFRFTDAEAELGAAIAEAQAQRNVGVELQAAVTLAQVRARMGRHAAARTTALEALELARRYRQVESEFFALLVLGDVENRWGNYERAVEQYRQAAELAERTGHQAWRERVYERLGRSALGLGDVPAAEDYFGELGQTADSAAYHYGLAKVYRDYGNLDASLDHYARAVAGYEAQGDRRSMSWALRDQAWALLQARPDAVGGTRALRLLRKAEVLLQPDDVASRYQLLIARGNVRLSLGDLDAALNDLHAAARLADTARHPAMQALLLHTFAVVHWQRGDAVAAERYFEEAVSTVEAIRDNLRSRERRATFVQDDAVHSVYKNFSAFLTSQGRAADAFSYVERARSRSLTDLLHTTQQGRALDLSDPVDQRIEAERQRIALARALSADAGRLADEVPLEAGSTRAGHLRREYLRADSIYHAAVRLGTRDPLATMLTATPLSTVDVQAMLLPGEALVTYSLTDDRARRLAGDAPTSVAYIITPGAVKVVPLDVDVANLSETVRFYREQLDDVSPDGGKDWAATSRRLHQRLVDPLLAALPPDVSHLHIVPEGILHYLPFATLRGADGRYLVERFTLSTTPSAGVLQTSRALNPRVWRSVLLLADPNGRLPGSRMEAERIGAIASLRTFPLVGEQATLANLKEFAFNYDVIHVATHGTFDSAAPLSSHLEFHGDEVLRVEEVGALELNAYLVTLSACETGLSGGLAADIPNGDEWIGLNQAFLAAGTPTVMTSLWAIDDQVSSDFMVQFYRNLQSGLNKSEALAAVQRAFARRAGVDHPFYWGAFTVVGDPL